MTHTMCKQIARIINTLKKNLCPKASLVSKPKKWTVEVRQLRILSIAIVLTFLGDKKTRKERHKVKQRAKGLTKGLAKVPFIEF